MVLSSSRSPFRLVSPEFEAWFAARAAHFCWQVDCYVSQVNGTAPPDPEPPLPPPRPPPASAVAPPSKQESPPTPVAATPLTRSAKKINRPFIMNDAGFGSQFPWGRDLDTPSEERATGTREWRPPWRYVETAPNATGRVEWRPPWSTAELVSDSVLEDKDNFERWALIHTHVGIDTIDPTLARLLD